MKKIILACLLLTISGMMYAQNDWSNKIAQSLWDKQNDAEVSFFVLLKTQVNLKTAKHFKSKNEKGSFVYHELVNMAEQTQLPLIAILENEEADFQTYSIVNGIWAKGNFELVEKLAKESSVANIFYNAPVRVLEPVEVDRNPLLHSRDDSLTWGVEKIKADAVWALGYKGQGVVIGGQDTGYGWQLPNLKAKYRGWDGTIANHNYNWHDAIREFSPLGDSINSNCGLNVLEPCDDHGHGTHTMGTMVAADTVVSLGVAPEAQWIGCRNMEDGWGAPNTYLECFEWFLAPTDLNNQNADPTKAPHVINNSWGCPEIEGCDTSNFVLLEIAINNLKLAGVVVVVSAGNSGPDCHSINTPAAIYESSFSVGALGMNDTITNFSSRGSVNVDKSGRTKPNITAPGQAVTSYWLQGNGTNNFTYLNASGTSMAGPHVAGLVALMISADSTLAGDVDRIESIIEQTAIGRTTDQNCGGVSGMTIPNNTYGFGVIDALAAVNQAIITAGVENELNSSGKTEIFPNPFNNQFWVKLEGFKGNTVFELYSADGRLIEQRNWDINWHSLRKININEIPVGVYFYKIYDNQTSTQGKLMKN
jgi:subtilisin family serine protease